MLGVRVRVRVRGYGVPFRLFQGYELSLACGSGLGARGWGTVSFRGEFKSYCLRVEGRPTQSLSIDVARGRSAWLGWRVVVRVGVRVREESS